MKPHKEDEKNQRQLPQKKLDELQKLIDSGKVEVEPDTNGLQELYDESETVVLLTSAQLKKLRVELKDLFLRDQEKVLKKLKSIVIDDSRKYDDVILLINRLTRFKNLSLKGTIPFEASEREFRSISEAILHAINTMEAEHLKSNKS